MTDPKITAATDKEIENLKRGCDMGSSLRDYHGRSLIARIEADRAEITAIKAQADLAQIRIEQLEDLVRTEQAGIAAKDAELADLEAEIARAVTPDDHEAEERAKLQARIAELEEEVEVWKLAIRLLGERAFATDFSEEDTERARAILASKPEPGR